MVDPSYVAHKEIIPINGFPAAFLPKLDATVISDLHIGYEDELARQGIFISKSQLDELIKKLDDLIKTVKTKRLIINGDLRHGFSKITKAQRKEIELFFLSTTSYYKEVLLIRGNHDNYIRPIAANFKIEVMDYLVEKEILITHGHKDHELLARKNKIIVIGHEHPSILLRNSNGQPTKFLAFIYFPTIFNSVLVILPPFSKFASGNVIELNKNKLLSVFTKKYAIIEEGIPFVIYQEIGTIELPKLSLLLD